MMPAAWYSKSSREYARAPRQSRPSRCSSTRMPLPIAPRAGFSTKAELAGELVEQAARLEVGRATASSFGTGMPAAWHSRLVASLSSTSG